MTHTYEFHKSPNKSLMPALQSILERGVCSDLQLVLNGQKFNVHKCILAVRSSPLAFLLK